MATATIDRAAQLASQPPDLSLRASEEIQGDILAGFLKDHRTYLFLRFTDAESGRGWLRALLPRIAKTSDVAAFNQRFSQARHQRGGDDPENLKALWVGLGLTFHGLITLRPELERDLREFPTPTTDPPEPRPQRRGFPSFVDGPAASAARLHDIGPSDPQTWLVGGVDDQGQPREIVDAMLTVAADDPEDLIVELQELRALAANFGVMTVYEQRGQTLPGAGAGHEHFGFKDGISQPGVKGFDFPDPANPQEVDGHPGSDLIAPGEFVLGYDRQHATIGEPDQPARPHPAWMKDGSFQVFRRLAQDVPGFWAQVSTAVQEPDWIDPPTAEVLAAKLVGRWRSGTPIDTALDGDNRALRDPRDDNNFEFKNDPAGHRCPHFAHIRKVYPRDSRFGDERRRILRRGIPFGLPFNPAAGRGHGVDAERGLLFVAFMADIEDQFEFLQKSWANAADFPPGLSEDTGPDPIIGNLEPPAPVNFCRAGDNAPRPLNLRRFVHTTGAVYAFAPSLRMLHLLALADGQQATVAAVVPLHRAPGRQPSAGAPLTARSQVTLLGAPESRDGQVWWQVRTTDGRQGWIDGAALRTS